MLFSFLILIVGGTVCAKMVEISKMLALIAFVVTLVMFAFYNGIDVRALVSGIL